MTNKEWLEYLANNAPDELAAWFDAEHVGIQERALDGGTEPENEDSREQLEADIEEWASIMDLEDQIDMIHGWLNRRAAILEREMVKFNRRYFDCVEQDKKIAELTRKMEILKAHGIEIVDAVAGGYEVYNEKIREVSELQAQVDELTAERERYRSKFVKCLDYADAIHALMDDEGMA